MITHLLFDVDGVLTFGGPLRVRLEEDYGIAQETSASFFRERFRACLVGHLDTKEELVRHLPHWGWSSSVDDFLRYWFARVSVFNTPLLAYIQQVRQKGIPCYVATNQEKYRTAYLIEQLGFAQVFDGMFSSAHMGCLKDDVYAGSRPAQEDLQFREGFFMLLYSIIGSSFVPAAVAVVC